MRRQPFDLTHLHEWPLVSVDVETSGLSWRTDRMFGVAVAAADPERDLMTSAYYDLRISDVKKALAWELKRCRRIVNHSAKFDAHFMREAGMPLPLDRIECTMVRAALIDEHEHSFSLNALAKKHLGRAKVDIYADLAKLFGGPPTREAQMKNLHRAPESLVRKYAQPDPELALLLWLWQEKEIEKQDLSQVWELERSLTPVLVDMERNGVRVDVGRTRKQEKLMDTKIDTAQRTLNKLAGREVNANSPPQMRTLFEIKKGEDGRWRAGGVLLETTGGGEASIGAETLRSLAERGNEAAKQVLTVRKMTKAKSFLKDHILGHEHEGRVYPNYNQARGENELGTGTGRFCVARGQRVLTPRGEIPIQDIVVGEYVYCYDDALKLMLKKITNKWCTGVKECVQMKWVSSSRTRGDNSGSIVCTPDHLVRLKSGNYIKASVVINGTKVLHARRRVHLAGPNRTPRIRVYGSDSYCKSEQSVIRDEVFKKNGKEWHIHHTGNDTTHNDVRHLEIIPAKEHTSHHSKELWKNPAYREKLLKHLNRIKGMGKPPTGPNNPRYKTFSKFMLFRAIISGGGQIRTAAKLLKVNRDTVTAKLREHGVSVSDVLIRFNGVGVYLSKGALLKSIDGNRKNKLDVAARLRIGHAKVDRLFASHEIERNHQLYKAVPVGPHETWDLEVEGSHNFIVEEICVHNSINSPALQQIPKRDADIAAIVRGCFIPDDYHRWGCADYNQFEFRWFAHYTKDDRLLGLYKNDPDIDFHQMLADMTGLPRDARHAGDKANCKQINLGLVFGMGQGKMAEQMGLPYTVEVRGGNEYLKPGPEAVEVFNKYHDAVPGVRGLLDQASAIARARGFVRTVSGRHIRFPGGKFTHKAGGLVFQGTSADCMKTKMVEMHPICKKHGWQMLLSVHDELDFSIPAVDEEAALPVLKQHLETFDGKGCPIECRVPIRSSITFAPNWWEACK